VRARAYTYNRTTIVDHSSSLPCSGCPTSCLAPQLTTPSRALLLSLLHGTFGALVALVAAAPAAARTDLKHGDKSATPRKENGSWQAHMFSSSHHVMEGWLEDERCIPYFGFRCHVEALFTIEIEPCLLTLSLKNTFYG
jgi:hypothetical protein